MALKGAPFETVPRNSSKCPLVTWVFCASAATSSGTGQVSLVCDWVDWFMLQSMPVKLTL